MSDKQIEAKKTQVKNTAVVTEGQLSHFLKHPSLPSLIALEQCFFAYIEHYDELVEASEKPEDLDLSEPETTQVR